ncbi:Uncharacterised protein [Vibrio cholerae]|nr:Uncharacterised protein [Vibrio cholerae]CSI46634.1 Uncharacterised protein [Vibrio cholerae]CSI64936.1 Uncharacterised protein [Vibrio cholerae]
MGKVFKLDQCIWPATLHGLHKLFNKVVVVRSSDTWMTPAHVHRVSKTLRVIRTHIQNHRKRIRWANATTSGVK